MREMRVIQRGNSGGCLYIYTAYKFIYKYIKLNYKYKKYFNTKIP
jgi:hypothetical protein